MDDNRSPVRPTEGRRTVTLARRLHIGGMATLAGMATVATIGVTALATPASAATVNAVATIASPGTTTALASGGSTTPFTVALPAQAACSGDTASGGYHVYSYLVQKGTALSGVTFINSPSTGYGLVDTTGAYYGPINTAIGTGQIVSIPNNFEWAPLTTTDGVPSTSLLYTGSGSTASGVWEGGLVCANTSGAVVDNWNTEITFHASSGDAHGYTWSAVPGLPVSGFTITTTSLPNAVVGTPYSQQLTTSGAPAGATIAWKKVSLPKGFALSSGGLLTGTPSAKGTGAQSVKVSVTDAKGGTPVTATIPLSVDEAPAFGKKSPTSAGFTEGQVGTVTLSATGFPVPTFSVTGGSLPSGVTLNPTTGVLSGTPAVTTSSSQVALTVTASNGVGPAATETFTLSVYAPLAVTTAPLTIAQGATVPGSGFQLATITGTEVGGTLKVKATGLPKGLKLSSTGVVTGTVSSSDAAKAYSVAIAASSKDGKTAVTASGTATITVTG